MNLDSLKTFLELAKLGSFSDAAKKLSISQPAVSFQMQKLEHELGVQLLERGQKGVTLTEAGRKVQAFATRIASEQHELMRALDELREKVSGELSLAASTIPGEYILPALLGRFKTLHPDIGIRVSVRESLKVLAALRSGEFDLGFCGIPPEGGEFESFKAGRDEIVLAVHPGHPFASRALLTLPELAAEPLIRRSGDSGTQLNVEAFLSRAGGSPGMFRSSMTLGSTESVVSAVEAGAGIAFVSNLAVKKSAQLGLVRVVPVVGLSQERDFWCVCRKGAERTRLVETFIAFVKEECGREAEGAAGQIR